MKTNQDHKRIAAAFERLFRTYPPQGQGSTPEDVARDRMERIKVYFEAVSLYLEEDVEAAVSSILSGSAPGMNPNFTPPAPVVAAECRRQMELRLRAMELERFHRPQLPPPDIARTADSQARVRELMQATLGKLGGTDIEDEAKVKAHKAHWDRVNQHFAPPQDEAEMARRLGYAVGDPEGEADAA